MRVYMYLYLCLYVYVYVYVYRRGRRFMALLMVTIVPNNWTVVSTYADALVLAALTEGREDGRMKIFDIRDYRRSP